MFKKLIFLFITTFILASVFFSGYLVVRETRGVTIASVLNMDNNKITNVGAPSAGTDLLRLHYLHNLSERAVGGYSIDSWCSVQWFSWCSGGYPPPEEECGDGICGPGENKSNCEEDCGIEF